MQLRHGFRTVGLKDFFDCDKAFVPLLVLQKLQEHIEGCHNHAVSLHGIKIEIDVRPAFQQQLDVVQVSPVDVPAQRVHPQSVVVGRSDVWIGPLLQQDLRYGRMPVDSRQVEAGLSVVGVGVDPARMFLQRGCDGVGVAPAAGIEELGSRRSSIRIFRRYSSKLVKVGERQEEDAQGYPDGPLERAVDLVHPAMVRKQKSVEYEGQDDHDCVVLICVVLYYVELYFALGFV